MFFVLLALATGRKHRGKRHHAAADTHGYRYLGTGHCHTGYYAGWKKEDASSLEACTRKCNQESMCHFISLKLGATCSRYNYHANGCLKRESKDHVSYAKPARTPSPNLAAPVGYMKIDGHKGCNANGKNAGYVGRPSQLLPNVPQKCLGGSTNCVWLGKLACDKTSWCWGFAVNSDWGVQMYNSKARSTACGRQGLEQNDDWTTYHVKRFGYSVVPKHIGCQPRGMNLGYVARPMNLFNDVSRWCLDDFAKCVALGKEACDKNQWCWGFAVNVRWGVQMYNSKAMNTACGVLGLEQNDDWTTYHIGRQG